MAYLRSVASLGFVLAATVGTASAESPPFDRAWSGPLEGCQLTPRLTTAAQGRLFVRMILTTGATDYSVVVENLPTAETEAHIHGPAPRGQDGPVIVTLPAGSPKEGTIMLTPDQRAALESGAWYVDVHTVGNPTGELRGQVDDRGSACPPPVDAGVDGRPSTPGADAGEGGSESGGCGGCASGGDASGLALAGALAAVVARRRRC